MDRWMTTAATEEKCKSGRKTTHTNCPTKHAPSSRRRRRGGSSGSVALAASEQAEDEGQVNRGVAGRHVPYYYRGGGGGFGG